MPAEGGHLCCACRASERGVLALIKDSQLPACCARDSVGALSRRPCTHPSIVVYERQRQTFQRWHFRRSTVSSVSGLASGDVSRLSNTCSINQVGQGSVRFIDLSCIPPNLSAGVCPSVRRNFRVACGNATQRARA